MPPATGRKFHLVDVTISGGTLKSSAGGRDYGFDSNYAQRRHHCGLLVPDRQSTTSILTLNSGTIGAGAIIETSGGTAIVSGTVTNGGTLFASATGDLIEIASGAVVNGGVALIGDGIVDIAGSSGESVRFLSNGSGGLEIADTRRPDQRLQAARCPGLAVRGTPTTTQFIDLVSVTSAPSMITSSYLSAARPTPAERCSSPAAARMVAAIKMVGSYSAGDFHITSGAGGTVAITDPAVPNGAASNRVRPRTFPRPGIDLPDIAFGAQTTLAYSQNADRHRRHADGERRPAHGGVRAPRQLHRRQASSPWPTAMAAR